MKKATAANIALCLVVVGWVTSFWGLFAHLGDPDPRVPRAVIEAENRSYWELFLGGVISIVGAMWLGIEIHQGLSGNKSTLIYRRI